MIKITEKEWSQQFEDLLRIFHWDFYHVYETTRYARRSMKGFPDYICWRGAKLLFCELKAEGRKPSLSQRIVLESLAATRADVFVFCPSDRAEIQGILRRQ